MINYFKTNSLKEATILYTDLVRSLGDNPKRLEEASKQFAQLTHPSYQLLILKLAQVDGIEFNCHGLILTVTKWSYNFRKELGGIRVPGYLTKFNEEKAQWSYIPYNKISLSQDVVINLLGTLRGIDIEKKGSWIWISGDTYKVKENLKAAVRGTFLKLGFKRATKQWYLSPKL